MGKAKPAKTVVKAFPAKALKDEFWGPPGLVASPATRLPGGSSIFLLLLLVLLLLLLRALLHLLDAFTHSSFCPGWLEGAWSSMAFRSQAALRGRSHVFHPCLAEKK